MQVLVRKISLQDLNNFTEKSAGNTRRSTTPNSAFQAQGRQADQKQQNQNIKRYQELVADRVEVTIKDQFVSRRDMWNFVQKLSERTINKGTQIPLQSIRFKIRNIYTAHKKINEAQKPRPNRCTGRIQREESPTRVDNSLSYVEQNSAIVMANYTRFSFCSKSSQVYCLIEMSKEMFTFDSEGFMQMEKCQLFVRSYLERCKADYSTHEVVFILYARLYYPQAKNANQLLQQAQDYCGRRDITLKELEKEGAYQFSGNKVFQDVYLKAGVVTITLDTTKTDQDKFLLQLKKYIQNFPKAVNWQIKCPENLQHSNAEPENREVYRLPCEVGDSERTNILEVINLALFNLNNEEIDLNLRTTGTQMLLLTAGMATYRVNSSIIPPTKSRIILGGVQVKMVSFAREPPYKTPLLIKCCSYVSPFAKNDNCSPMKKFSKNTMFISPDTRAQSLAQEYANPKTKKDQTLYMIDWMEVTFLPHIKLLETHLSSQQLRKANALMSLSKTPLLAPQFCLFQQVHLVTSVFGGLARPDERLFEPHSMFVKSLATKNQDLAVDDNDSILSGGVKRRLFDKKGLSEPLRKKKQTRKQTYWQIDPDMYQLRKPESGNDKYLLEDAAPPDVDQSQLVSRFESVGTSQQDLSKHNNIQDYSDQESISFYAQSVEDVLTFAKMQSSNSRRRKSGCYGGQEKRSLKTKLEEYDAMVNGEMQPNSPMSSSYGSPMKYVGLFARQHSNSPMKINSVASKTRLLNEGQQQLFSKNILEVEQSLKSRGHSPYLQTRTQLMKTMHQQTSHLGHSIGNNVKDKYKLDNLDKSHNEKPNGRGTTAFNSVQKIVPAVAMSAQKPDRFTTIAEKPVPPQVYEPVPNKQKRKNEDHLNSYARRWGQAVQIFQLSLFDSQKLPTNTQEQNSSRAPQRAPYSLSYDQLPEWGGFDRRLNAYDLAVTQNYFDPLCRLMDPFWRQLSDVVLLPLTTQYYPTAKDLQGYANELHPMDQRTDVEENLCLRLTQNFQFVHERGSCDFKPARQARQCHYRMAFRDIYSDCQANGGGQFETQTHFKFKDADQAIDEKGAAFRYLLYNHHTKHFQVKASQESRLFEIRKLKNLDVVQSDLREAKEHCVKLPQVSFVIFYDRQEAARLRAANDPGQASPQPAQERSEEEEEEEEKSAFEKLRAGLVSVLQGMGPSNRSSLESLSSIRVVKQSTIHMKSRLATADEPDPVHMPPSQASSRVGSAQKNGNPFFAKDDFSGFDTPTAAESKVKWPQDIMNSFMAPPSSPKQQRDGNFAIPELDSSRASGASALGGYEMVHDAMNMSMQNFNQHDMHASLANNHYDYLRMMRSGRAIQHNSQYQKKQSVTKMKNQNSKKCVINLSDQQQDQSQRPAFGITAMQQPVRPPQDSRGSQYLLEHDACYTTGACFHLKFSWIFARGPEIQERVVKRLLRQVKELSNGCFKTLPMSEIVRSLQLNPFECETQLRQDFRKRTQQVLEKRNMQTTEQLENQTNNRISCIDDFSMIEYGDEEICSIEEMSSKLSHRQRDLARNTIMSQTSTIEREEIVFQRMFPRLITTHCGYVLDNKSKDESCTYFVERETGLSYLRYNSISNEINFSENDIVNNAHGDYQASIKQREKVEGTIFALDILLSLIFQPKFDP